MPIPVKASQYSIVAIDELPEWYRVGVNDFGEYSALSQDITGAPTDWPHASCLAHPSECPHVVIHKLDDTEEHIWDLYGHIPGGYEFGISDINNHPQIIGWVDKENVSSDEDGFIWSKEEGQLFHDVFYVLSVPIALNNLGYVVGVGIGYRPDPSVDDEVFYLWDTNQDRTYLLNDLIPPDLGWSLNFVGPLLIDINDDGQICGMGMLNGVKKF